MAKEKKNVQVNVESDNPYLNARQVWMERYGTHIQQARTWRMVAILVIITLGISVSGNVYQMTQSKIDRYFVAIDDLGKAVAEKIHNENKPVPERLKLYEVTQVISNWRSVTVDNALQNKMIRSLNAHTAGTARGVLAEWYRDNNPAEVAKSGKLVEVEFRTAPLPVTSDSYRVEWIEVVRNFKGVVIGRQNFEAILTVQISPPTTEEEVMANPAGVYVVNISTAKVLNR